MRVHRSTEERIGRLVLLPLKLLGLLLMVPLLVIAYPLVAVAILIKGEGKLTKRVKSAAFWPLGLLALNDFLSLGGLNNPTLSKISDWLNRANSKR